MLPKRENVKKRRFERKKQMNKETFRGKSAVIDVGSNSVRLMFVAGGKVLYKTLETTRLGEGLAFSSRLKDEAMRRTAEAISAFVARGKAEGAQRVYAYATAAVREAENREEFRALVRNVCGAELEVIAGEEEAALGMDGALKGADGATIDVGGASTEIAVRSGGKTAYKKSVPVGVVRIKDLCGRDVAAIKNLCEKYVSGFIGAKTVIKQTGGKAIAIGGTATTLGARKAGLKEYDGAKVTGVPLTQSDLRGYAKAFLALPVGEIEKLPCMPKKRADVIGGGAAWLYAIAEYLDLSEILVSDEDNLEGYARKVGIL